MKKFYIKVTAAILVACLILASYSNLKAQSVCPAGGQKVFSIAGYDVIGQPVRIIKIENFMPNGGIILFQGLTGKISGFTDATGEAVITVTDPTFIPDRVSVLVGGLGECSAPIPASVSCGSAVLNIKYPANATLGTPDICVLYLLNSLAGGEVRVFDGLQNFVSTTSNAPAFTNISGYVGFVYPCDRLPTSITTCAGGFCCSAAIPSAAALPIKLTSFTAKLSTDNKVLLNWVSNLEIGSDRYVVEKSADGRNFAAISEIKSAGNTTATRTYAFTDAGFNATAYYRLKMVDIDGKAEFSKVVYVNLKGGSGVVTQIFPNPFKSDIQIIGISSSDLNSKNIRIFNAMGQQVNYKIVGANAISLDANAPSGMYILAVKDQRFKLIKE